MSNTSVEYWRAVSPILPVWLGSHETQVTLLRVSSTSQADAMANADAAAAKLAHRPGVRMLTAAGGAERVLANTPDAARLRRTCGITRIERQHAHPAATGQHKHMGWLWPDEESRELLVMLTDSAAANNVAIAGDPLRSNAVAELLVQLISHPRISGVHFSDWTRIVRDTRHGTRVVDAARTMGCALFEGDTQLDITSSTGGFMSMFRSQISDSELTTLRTRTMRGVLGRLSRSEATWPYAADIVPPGYVVALSREHHDTKAHRIATIKPDTRFTAGWQEFYTAIAAGATYLKAGRILAKHKIPCRGVVLGGKTYDRLSDRQLGAAARANASRRNYDTLRTRRYVAVKSIPFPLAAGERFEGHLVDRMRGQYGAVHISVDLPDHGIVLTEAQWQAWERRLSSRQLREPAAAVPRHPLASVARWEEAGWQYNLTSAGTDPWCYYTLRRRPLTRAVDAVANARGWLAGEGELVLSVRCADADRAFGRAIEAAAASALGKAAVLKPLARQLPDVAETQRRQQRRLRELEVALTETQDDVAAARDALAMTSTARRRERLAETEAELQAIESELARLRQAAIEIPPVITCVEQQAQVQVQTLAGLAGILQGGAGRGLPRVVNDTIRHVTNGTMRLSTKPGNARVVRLTATVSWPAADGHVMALEVCGDIGNAHRTGQLVTGLGQAVADLVLGSGKSLDEARELVRTHRSSSAADLTRVAARWLAQHHPISRRMSWALLDCPIQEAKAVSWSIITCDDPPAGVEPGFVELIRATYFGGRHSQHGGFGSWSGRVRSQRLLLSVFTAALGSGQDLSEGMDNATLLRLAGFPDTGNVKYVARPLALFDTHPDNVRALVPRRCPVCGQWLLHVLRTPEVNGLICRSCCAMPGGPCLPAGYLALWDAISRPGSRGVCGTRLADSEEYRPNAPVPGQASRRLPIGEAAAYLGSTTNRLRAMTNRGQVHAHRSGTGKFRVYDRAELNRLKQQLVAPAERFPGCGMPPGYMSLRDAAARLNVRVAALRKLALSTAPGVPPLPYRRATIRVGSASIVIAQADVEALEVDWVDANSVDRIPIGLAARRAGVGQFVLRVAADRNELPYRDVGGKRRFRPQDVDVWVAGPGRTRTMLTPARAAARAGISQPELRAAIRDGRLQPQRTPGGHIRVSSADVDRLWSGGGL